MCCSVSGNSSSFLFLLSSSSLNTRFGCIMWAAVWSGDAKKLGEVIRQDPGFNVNMGLDDDWNTLLHLAYIGDSRTAVIPLLLAHPDVDVNVMNRNGATPFYCACANGFTSCVRLLLKDSRVKVNEPTSNGYTPLWHAARHGRFDLIKWWIASGREVDLGKPGDVEKTDAIGKAEERGETKVATLLERFKSDAAKTRSEVRQELGVNGQYYPYYYYSILFLFLFSFSVHNLLHFSPAIFSLSI